MRKRAGSSVDAAFAADLQEMWLTGDEASMTDKSSLYAKDEKPPVVRRRRHRHANGFQNYIAKDAEPTEADDADDSFLACDTKKRNEMSSFEFLRLLVKYHGDADDRMFFNAVKKTRAEELV